MLTTVSGIGCGPATRGEAGASTLTQCAQPQPKPACCSALAWTDGVPSLFGRSDEFAVVMHDAVTPFVPFDRLSTSASNDVHPRHQTAISPNRACATRLGNERIIAV